MSGGKADKAKGKVEMAKGVSKEKIGEATNNEKLKREGRSEKVKGKAKDVKGDVKESFKNY